MRRVIGRLLEPGAEPVGKARLYERRAMSDVVESSVSSGSRGLKIRAGCGFESFWCVRGRLKGALAY